MNKHENWPAESGFAPSPTGGKATHVLKSWPMFFDEIERGGQMSGIRCTMDREFQVGDELRLQRWDPVRGEYTGREMSVEVTHVQVNKNSPCIISEQALHSDYCVFSVRRLGGASEA